jgi:hypothetical protein
MDLDGMKESKECQTIDRAMDSKTQKTARLSEESQNCGARMKNTSFNFVWEKKQKKGRDRSLERQVRRL